MVHFNNLLNTLKCQSKILISHGNTLAPSVKQSLQKSQGHTEKGIATYSCTEHF